MAGSFEEDGEDSTAEAAAKAPGQVTRLYIEGPLAAGLTLQLAADRAHYLRHVLRAEPGALVGLFNGRDGEWSARILGYEKRSASLAVETRRRPQAATPDLWLVFAPIKRQRIDLLAEKATELGVAALWPIFTRRTAMTRVNLERLAANATEAAEQTERLTVPQIFAPVTLEQLIRDWPVERHLLLCAEAGVARPIADLLAARRADPAARAAAHAVMCGPEGGFAADELDALGKLPFVSCVGLGPRILRADTAAIAALACFQAWLGDGGDRPPQR